MMGNITIQLPDLPWYTMGTIGILIAIFITYIKQFIHAVLIIVDAIKIVVQQFIKKPGHFISASLFTGLFIGIMLHMTEGKNPYSDEILGSQGPTGAVVLLGTVVCFILFVRALLLTVSTELDKALHSHYNT